MIYLISFFTSIIIIDSFCFIKSNISSNRHFSVNINFIVYILAAIPILYIGTNRDVVVGTDNYSYELWFQKMVQSKDIFFSLRLGSTDILYNLLAYCVSRFTNNYNVLCFWTTLFTIVPFLIAVKIDDDIKDKSFACLCFYLFFYCYYLNIVRQGIALNFCYLGFVLYKQSKYIPFIFSIIIASLFHNSAILFFTIPILDKFISRGNYYFRLMLILFIILASFVFFGSLISVLVDIGVLHKRFISYNSELKHVPFYLKQTVTKLPLLFFLSFYVFKKKLLGNRYIKLLYAMAFMEFIISQIGGAYGPLERISLYFRYSYIMLISIISTKINNFSERNLFKFIIVIYLLIYWVYFVIMNGYCFKRPVYPYIFAK